VVETLSTQLEDKRFVAVEIIAQDHQRQPRMVLTHPSYQAFGRIQLTVLLGLPSELRTSSTSKGNTRCEPA